ncbi:MAG: methylated-DNA--[protein]-cysteine S-methyltransferase [Alphaproteobacteria bacterium]|nr:methylated-DNA--[protein]-cysteine S-methyltransferase [Alphaproteobacteria bacterium]
MMTESSNYSRIGGALAWLADHYQDQPALEDIAARAGLSPHHFQRVFKAHVGVSPKKFLAKLTLDHAKESLARHDSVLDASLDAGLSGPGRLHDLFVTHEAMTPGQWKAAASGMTLFYGWHESPFGDCLIVAAHNGVCAMGFAKFDSGDDDRRAVLTELAAPYGGARLVADIGATAPFAEAAFAGTGDNLHLILKGTPFQLKVWGALLRIPAGQVTSYGDLASHLGMPRATRAVASAVGRNAIAWIIPCHRVLRANGAISGYRWGVRPKRLMLAWEAAA